MESLIIVFFLSGLLIGGVLGTLLTLLRSRSAGNGALIHVTGLETELNLTKGQLQQR